MFDAGVNFIRIGQYENSSDYTSWDWVERKTRANIQSFRSSMITSILSLRMASISKSSCSTGIRSTLRPVGPSARDHHAGARKFPQS